MGLNLERQPAYIPSSFTYSHVTPGTATALIGRDPNQLTYTYVRRVGLRTEEVPLRVVLAPPGTAELKATESHGSTSYSLPDHPQLRAEYYDGYWTEGPGIDQVQVAADEFINWDRGRLHSILVRGKEASCAVLAPADVSVSEMLKIADSIPQIA